jgi:hypothetical protein
MAFTKISFAFIFAVFGTASASRGSVHQFYSSSRGGRQVNGHSEMVHV